MAERDKELVSLRLWLVRETDPKRRAEIQILTSRRLRAVGLFDQALDALERAKAEAPEDPMVLRSLGLEQFRQGAIASGLKTYDQGRWQLESFAKYHRAYPAPFWQGQPLEGKTLLVWAEQGIGDQIMQARILEQLIALGAHVTLEADPRLKPLLKVKKKIDFVTQQVQLDPALLNQKFDYQTSMLSAWRFVEDPLSCAQCLKPDLVLATRYKTAWQKMGKRKNIGLSWHSKAPKTGANRGLKPEYLRPIAESQAVRMHSLQYGAFDLVEISKTLGAPLLSDPQSDPLKDLSRQVAQIASMDLVITIDNATAHLAGALGTPCWVMLPKSSDWRWGTPSKPLPLYPSVRPFRTDLVDDWSTVLWPMFDAFEDWLKAART